MKKIIDLLTVLLIVLCSQAGFAQGKVTRNITQKVQSKPSSRKQSIVPAETRGYLNGHEWVDLGLPSGTKWATMNIGATRSTEEGTYYAWGEVSTPYKSEKLWNGAIVPDYSSECCRLYGRCVGSISGTSYDVAKSKWGEGWILPEQNDIEELEKFCNLEVINILGVDGYKITGPNGNYIFFPCTGVKSGALPDTPSIETPSTYWIGTEESSSMGCVLSLDRMEIGTHFANSKNVGYAIRAITRIK